MCPKVSVVIPTFQAERTVGAAIESVLNQEYKSYEVIVVDDGSKDNTQEILKRYYDKIIIIKTKNYGVSSARNTGIEIARGEFIAFLDADDIWKKEKLKYQVPMLENNENVGMVYSDIGYFDDTGIFPYTHFQRVSPKRGHCISEIFIQNGIPLSTAVVKAICFKYIGGFDEKLSTCADYDMWLRILKYWEIDYENRTLAYYRFSEGQMHKNWEIWIKEKVLAQEKAYYCNENIRKININQLSDIFFSRYLKLAKLYIREGKLVNALFILKKYIQLNRVTIDFLETVLYYFRYNSSIFIKKVLS